MNQVLIKRAEHLADRPYLVEVVKGETTDDQPIYLARSPELEGCLAQGETIDDAIQSLREARVDYIYSLLEDNLPVPDPTPPMTLTSVSDSITFEAKSAVGIVKVTRQQSGEKIQIPGKTYRFFDKEQETSHSEAVLLTAR
jgi:predicted RNase H-like HicB family nuclease